jgi:hypothetical protein
MLLTIKIKKKEFEELLQGQFPEIPLPDPPKQNLTSLGIQRQTTVKP